MLVSWVSKSRLKAYDNNNILEYGFNLQQTTGTHVYPNKSITLNDITFCVYLIYL